MSVRVKQIKKITGGKDGERMNEVITKMMGGDDADPEIIVPKYKEVTDLMLEIAKLLRLLGTFERLAIDFPETKQGLSEIVLFVNEMLVSLSIDEPISEAILYRMSRKDINKNYRAFKDDKYIKLLIKTASDLKTWCPNIVDESKMDITFVLRSVGSVKPFAFSSFELQSLWRHTRITNKVKTYIMQFLYKFYAKVHKLFTTTTSCDVDPAEISAVVFDTVRRMRTIPELRGCSKAFTKIEEYGQAFNKNIDNYYRSALIAGNSSIMIEKLITDVASNQKDPSILRQLKTITTYMKKKVSKSNTAPLPPHISSCFNLVDNSFSMADSDSKSDSKEDQPADQIADAIESAFDIEEEARVEHDDPFWKYEIEVPALVYT